MAVLTQNTHNIHSTRHFFRYTLPVPGWTPFCLQNCLNSWWQRFNKLLETFLWDFGPYWHDSITQLLQICWQHIHDTNLLLQHISKVLFWMEIWRLWRPVEFSELIAMFKKPVWDDLTFVTLVSCFLSPATTQFITVWFLGPPCVPGWDGSQHCYSDVLTGVWLYTLIKKST